MSGVLLSQEEIDTALNQAKIAKLRVLEHQRKLEMREKAILDTKMPWETDKFREFIKWKALQQNFEIDGSNELLFEALICYFNFDKKFESFQINSVGQSPDIHKGLFIFGSVGVGKTKIMGLFQQNKRLCYQTISCRKLVNEYVKIGYEVLEPLSNIMYPIVSNFDNFFQKEQGICLDDLGTESSDAVNFGNRKNVMEQLILDRYDNEVPFWHTHITSNLNPSMIRDRYGERVVSRMREMFNIIEIKGNDRRK